LNVRPPPSSIAACAAKEYEDLRSPERFGQAQGGRPPAGFDAVSAAIGARAKRVC